jgi:glycosyltransferase involved in cell wall biosynthesis
MKLHFFSNAPHAPTGYGVMMRQVLPRLKARGHEITLTAYYGLHGAPLTLNGITIYPGSQDAFGQDVFAADAIFVGADAVISNMDVWVIAPEQSAQVPWYPWLPIDHDPVPPAVLEHLQPAKLPLSYSRWGVEKLREAGREALYVPAGVDVEIFKPHAQKDAREKLGLPAEAFIVGMNGANKGSPGRKYFDGQIRAFAEFEKRHPEAFLYLHTDPYNAIGEDIPRLLELAGVKNYAFTATYQYVRGLITPETLAMLYSAFDVLLHASMSEGFGIVIIEAQACGCPAIVTDFSAMPELLYAGWKVGYVDKFWTAQESYQVIPAVAEIREALEKAYAERGNQALREQARVAMVQHFEADQMIDTHWKAALTRIAAEIAHEKLSELSHAAT